MTHNLESSMTLADMIPQMTVSDLESLYANALRLNAGEGPQQAKAAALLPALELEIDARRVLAPAKAPARKPRAKKSAVAA
jgi:hypothetical protein